MHKRLAIGLTAAILLVVLAIARRHDLFRFAIQTSAGLAGYSLRTADFNIGWSSAAVWDLHVTHGGEPVLDVRRAVVGYSLRDLLPGSRHRFGLKAVEIDGATLWLIRHRDGSFNVAIPHGAAPHGPQRVNSVPLSFTLALRDSRIVLREPQAYDASAKELRIDQLDGNGSIDTAAVTRYRLTGAFEERGPRRFTVAGRVDAVAGYALHHASAPYFPARALANYFADTPAVRVLGGEAHDFDARIYAFDVVPNVAPKYHVSLTLDVSGGRLAIQALDAPVEGLRARLQVVDDAFFVRGAQANLAGLPLHIEGGGYDLTGALTGRAQLRLGVWGDGDLSALRRAFAFARPQPIAGAARLGVLVHGAIDDPVIVARVTAPHASYRAMPFDGLAAGVVYHSNTVALAPVRVGYGGIAVRVDGTMEIGRHLHSRFALHVEGPASRLPYLDEMLGPEPVVVDAAATGDDLLFHIVGSAASQRGVQRLAALVDTNPNGTAAVEPFWFHTERGNLDAAYRLDRPHGTSAFWLASSGLRMRAVQYKTFPGVSLPQMPPVEGSSVGMTLAGGGSGNDIVLAGNVSGADASIAGVKFHAVEAAFGGTLREAAVNLLRASGPWGTFAGHGAFSSQRFVAVGAYRGSFEGLQPFLGNAITGHGPIAGTVGIGIEPSRILVQGSDLAMPGATLHGIPIDRASLTLAVEGDRLRVFSANARAAGGDIVAAGTLALSAAAQRSGPNAVALIARRLQAAQLRGIGLPLDSGTLSAVGTLAAGAPLPSFGGDVAIDRGSMAHFTMTGNGAIRLAGDAVELRNVVGALGSTYALVDGRIADLESGSPAYALDATVPAAQIAPALHSFSVPNFMTDGTFNARLRVAGRSVAPSVSGHVGVPAGDVNGLPFIDGSAWLAADPSGVAIRDGSVLVGTTGAAFAAVERPHQSSIGVSAPHARLADFNNFFDTGDTLAGNGSVKIAAASRGERITSSGNIDVRGFRYRNLPIGDTKAVWSSARNTIAGTLAVGGDEGMLHAHGSIGLTPGASWQSTLLQSRFDLAATVGNLDLSLWLPALGMPSLPITGRVSGNASLAGRYPNLDLHANAGIVGGTLGPLTLDRADLALHTAGNRVVIDKAEMATPALAALATGTIGVQPTAPLDVQVHATTDDLAQLVYDVSRVKVPVRGSFESTLKIAGNFKNPRLEAGFDAANVLAYGIPIASLFGEARLERGSLVLSNAGATFVRGEATLAGSLPLQLSPLRLAAPDQPISFDLDVVGLDPAIFDAALGNNTKMSGLIDAHVGLSGTILHPDILGRVALANGSYVSDFERTPITQIAAALAFNRTSASVTRAFGRFGAGTIQGSGSVQFANGFSAAGARLALQVSAHGAQFDFPAYGNGTLDGRLTISKETGSAALLSGNATLSNATLSFASFVRVAQQSSALAGPPLPLAFNLQATAGKNVRVRGSGYGAGLDIGVAGSVKLGGTLAAPTLAGNFDSTGGTLTYFDRAFRVSQGSVRFNPSDGVLPTLHAVATTTVVNPDPDRARNPYGSADITIRADGPISGLKIGLTTNPPGYTQAQILGLIAPFGGFINGIGYTRESMLAQQQPNGIVPLGSVSPIPNVGVQQRSTITVGQEAFNLLNAQFTAGLLSPLESTLGQGLGLSSINLTLGYYGNVGVTASRFLGKAVSVVYAVTFGIPQTQSFGLMVVPSPDTSAALNFYVMSGPQKLFEVPTAPVGYGASYLATEPLVGNSGFSLTYARHFW